MSNYDFEINQNGIDYIVNLSIENNSIKVNCYERQPNQNNEFYAQYTHEQLIEYSPKFRNNKSIKDDFIMFKAAIDSGKVRINRTQNNEINLTFSFDEDEEISQNIELPLEVNGEFNNAEIEYMSPRYLPTISVKMNTIKVRRPTVYIDADNNEISKTQFYNGDILNDQEIQRISSPKKKVLVQKLEPISPSKTNIKYSIPQKSTPINYSYTKKITTKMPQINNTQITRQNTYIPNSPKNKYLSPPKVINEINYNSQVMSPPREQIQYTNYGSPSKNQMNYSAYIRDKKKNIFYNTSNSPGKDSNLSNSTSAEFEDKINELSNQITYIKNDLENEKSTVKKILLINENLKKEIEKLKQENIILRQNENVKNENNLLNQQLMESKNKLCNDFEEYKNKKEGEIQQYIEQINKLVTENNKYKEILSRLSINNKRKSMRIIKGEIIEDNKELEFLTERICQEHKKITLNLLYKATVDSDSATAFHNRCDKASCSLVLVKTNNNKRFGGFTKMTWAGKSEDKKDNEAFIFSLDKMKIYDIIPDQDAIGCYPTYGPIFLGCQIRIYDNAFKKGGSTFEKGLNYQTEEDFELTDGEQNFGVKEIEVYGVELED